MTDKENYIARQVLDRLIKSTPAAHLKIEVWLSETQSESFSRPVWDEAAIKEFAKQFEKKKK